ncbi:MAG: hypothetical protein L0154_06975 [Chloroflexi bacterium]|nr:hypothetical protein [Chloroflexota bacterium]
MDATAIGHLVEESLVVENITDDSELREIAEWMVSENYSTLSTHPHVDPYWVYDNLLREYHAKNAQFLLAIGYNPNTGLEEPLGTLRVVPYATEFMDLFDIDWSSFDYLEFDPDNAAELGRFTVAESARRGAGREAGLLELVTYALTTGGGIVATLEHQKKQKWGILTNFVVQLLQRSGVDISPAPPMPLNNDHHHPMFDIFDVYWRQNIPMLYRFWV